MMYFYIFIKRGPFVAKFCTNSVTDNANKCCKFDYCMISTFSCVYSVAKPYVIVRDVYAH